MKILSNTTFNATPKVGTDTLATINSLEIIRDFTDGISIATLKWNGTEHTLYAPATPILGSAAYKGWSGVSSDDSSNLVTLNLVESKLSSLSIPDASQFATKDDLNNYVSISGGDNITGTLSISGKFTAYNNMEIQGDLFAFGPIYANSQKTNKYVTQNWVNEQGYLKNGAADTIIAYAPDRSTYATFLLNTASDGGWMLRKVSTGLCTYSISPTGGETCQMELTTSGNLTIAGSLSQRSDETLKDILSYEPKFGVNDIANAPIYYFSWKDRKDEVQHLGTIAQYWKEITPECVRGDEGNMSMDYSTIGLISSIINAREVVRHEDDIKVLNTKVDTLTKEINDLKEIISKIENYGKVTN